MNTTEKKLIAEQLWFERHCAAVLMQALANSGLSIEEVEKRARFTKGSFLRYVGRLAKGKTGVGKPETTMITAMGARFHLGFQKLEQTGE